MSKNSDIFDTFLLRILKSLRFLSNFFWSVVTLFGDFFISDPLLSIYRMRLSINIRSTYSGVVLSIGSIYGRRELTTDANECVRDRVWAPIRSPIRIFTAMVPSLQEFSRVFGSKFRPTQSSTTLFERCRTH